MTPTFREAFFFWLKLGFISFGGPTGQIAIMHRELVEQRKWIEEDHFLNALNYCMLLPGPEATQLAIYIGWRLHGTPGGIVAGTLFVLPSAVLLWALARIYAVHGQVIWLAAVFAGLKPAVLAIVAAALLRLGSKVLKNRTAVAISALAFLGIFAFHLPYPAIIGAAALIGLAGERPTRTATQKPKPMQLRTLLLGLLLWWAPLGLVAARLGTSHVLFQQGLFFSKAAMITFGGAYAVLPYVTQQAVESHHWLTAGQMLDGLGLAETTPGPLIMVLQFVGFMGAWSQPSPFSPLVCATLGAAMTTWCTFVPCFLWIFLGAPYLEKNAHLSAALSAITAAVVGVILNLAVWLGWQVLGGGDLTALAIFAVMFWGMARRQWQVVPVVLASAAWGLTAALREGL